MMLIQALRLHLANGPDGARGGVGWLFALSDKQMSAAITCMHYDPGAAMDAGRAGAARGDVAVGVCAAVQRDGGVDSDGVPDALAYAPGGRQAEEFR